MNKFLKIDLLAKFFISDTCITTISITIKTAGLKNNQHKKYFHQIRQNSNTYKQKVIAKIDHTITISKLVSNIAWKGSQFSEKYIYPISGRKIVLGTLFHYEMLLRNENLRGTKSLNSNDSTGIPGFTNLANLCAV